MLEIILASVPLVWLALRVGVRALDRREAMRCSFGDQAAYSILMSCRDDFEALKGAFSQLKRPDERYFYSLCASRFITRKILKDWVSKEPESADARLCYGAQLLQSAWDARGYGRSFQISNKSADKYHELLTEAEFNFEACIALDNEDSTPWAYLLVVYTGLYNDPELRDYYFENAIARDPENWAAHMHMIIALSEKWGGSNEEMMAFAREASDNAEEGSDLSLLFVKAYLEVYKYKEVFEEDLDGALAFKNSPSILSDINTAYDNSNLAKGLEDKKTTIFARYNISGWFCLVGDDFRLKNELIALGRRISDVHWRWVGSEGMLKEAKNRLGISS